MFLPNLYRIINHYKDYYIYPKFLQYTSANYACYLEFLGDLLSNKLFYNELSFFNKKITIYSFYIMY